MSTPPSTPLTTTAKQARLASKTWLAAAAALLASALAPAHATPAIANGGFETVTTAASTEFGTRYAGQVVTGWTTSGYNFLFKSGTADTSGAANEYGEHLMLWGPGNGSANGLPASSPAGGNLGSPHGLLKTAR